VRTAVHFSIESLLPAAVRIGDSLAFCVGDFNPGSRALLVTFWLLGILGYLYSQPSAPPARFRNAPMSFPGWSGQPSLLSDSRPARSPIERSLPKLCPPKYSDLSGVTRHCASAAHFYTLLERIVSWKTCFGYFFVRIPMRFLR